MSEPDRTGKGEDDMLNETIVAIATPEGEGGLAVVRLSGPRALKIAAAVKNASAFLKLQEREGSFDSYIWSFTYGKIIQNRWQALKEIPAVQDQC